MNILLIFIFLFLVNFIQANSFDFSINREEKLISIYEFNQNIYTLSKIKHNLILRKFKNNQIIKNLSIHLREKIFKGEFIEILDNFYIVVVLKNNDRFFLRFLDDNLNFIRDVVLNNQSSELIY